MWTPFVFREWASVHQILRPSAQSQVPGITATASSNFKVLAASPRWFTLVALESNSSATSPLPFYTFSQCIADINFFFASFQFTIGFISHLLQVAAKSWSQYREDSSTNICLNINRWQHRLQINIRRSKLWYCGYDGAGTRQPTPQYRDVYPMHSSFQYILYTIFQHPPTVNGKVQMNLTVWRA
jgi:hypothetical protein